MKKYIIIIINLLGILNLSAQNKTAVEKNLIKLNLLLPGVVYEHGFNEKNTLYSELSIDFGYRNNSFSGNSWIFLPFINEQFRHYYNLEKRSLNGKRTAGNSGNFLALNAIYNFKSFSTNDNNYGYNDSSFIIAPVWGMQRTYKHNFNLGLNAGVGYLFYSDKNYDNNSFVPVINFSIGWVIGK